MTHDLSVTLDELIRELRHKAGMTQAQLAEQSGVAESTIAHVETARRSLSVENLRAIATALNASNGDRKRLSKARDRASERLSTRRGREPTDIGPRHRGDLISLPQQSAEGELEEIRQRVARLETRMSQSLELSEDLTARVEVGGALTAELARRLTEVERRLDGRAGGEPTSAGA